MKNSSLRLSERVGIAVLASTMAFGQTGASTCNKDLRAGLSEYGLGHLDAALTSINAALQCNPKMLEARLAAGDVYARMGNETEALRAYTLVLDIDPKNIDALRGAASIYLRHDNNEKAVPLLEALTALVPKDAQAHVDLGAGYAATGRLDDAEVQFLEATRLEPNNAAALTGLGNLYQKKGRSDEATELLKRAAKLAPKAFEPHFILGSIYNGQGQYLQAATELQTAIRLGGTGSAEVYYQLARAEQNLGRDRERRDALARFTQINEQANKEKETRNEVFRLMSKAKTLVDAGDLETAAADLEEASKLGKPDDQILFRLAGLQYDLKRYDAARTNIQQAISLAPSIWLYHFLLGLIESDCGRLPEAEASLKLAVHLNPSAAEASSALEQVEMKRKHQ